MSAGSSSSAPQPRVLARSLRLWLHALLGLAVTAAPLHPRRCGNTHQPDSDCNNWAAKGECNNNPGFMKQACALACDSCGWVDNRCADRAGQPPAKRNHEIQSTFERAVTFEEFGPRIHSRPPHGPWIITFDNFVTDDEAAAFIDSTDQHFKRSLAGDMVSPVRTSQQAWCQYGIAPDCVDHPLVHRVHDRVVNVTGVPKVNAEFFQVLRYEPGQFYKTHHDQNTDPDSLAGVRLFTFFIYLQSPEAGGETFFPIPNVTIQPKKGSALLWPNVRDNDVRLADMRTEHEAVAPTAGRKFSANLWLHMYDFRGPNMKGCDMGRRVAHSNADVEHGGTGIASSSGSSEEQPDDDEAKYEL